MASDMFLMIDKIKGEATDSKHKDEIDIVEFGFGMSQNVIVSGQGLAASKANVQFLSITKYLDKATPDMMSFLIAGMHVGKITLSVRKSGGAAKLDFYKIDLTTCVLAGYRTMPQSSDDRCMESWTIAFGAFQVSYIPQGNDGSAAGAEVGFKYNLVANSSE
jgi:type VI secretion system secreted protein Hcp